jgi:hypothetical protein
MRAPLGSRQAMRGVSLSGVAAPRAVESRPRNSARLKALVFRRRGLIAEQAIETVPDPR